MTPALPLCTAQPRTSSRREFMSKTAVALAVTALPAINFAATTDPAGRKFSPVAGTWRSFDVTTRVDIAKPQGVTRLWIPIPSVNTSWQQSLESSYQTNGVARMEDDNTYGARMLYVEFPASEAKPFVELTSRVKTQSRDLAASVAGPTEDAASLRAWTQASSLVPTDGIVRTTALEATKGARTDFEKVQKIFDWVVTNTYREPKVRGCGEGDIKAMLETNNLGGKCADLNTLFVGLCRAVGVPARDVYGVRLAPSAFGYRELGGNSASLKGAQHCRAEVHLAGRGWVAMDPADVAKVMRQETPEWLKSADHPLVAPVNKALFGGWEGNWMAYNVAHDVALPGSNGPKMGFLMYPVAESGGQRLDSYAPDDFKYQISARELTT
jgi:transglutaminase-like putative cysteine protease